MCFPMRLPTMYAKVSLIHTREITNSGNMGWYILLALNQPRAKKDVRGMASQNRVSVPSSGESELR